MARQRSRERGPRGPAPGGLQDRLMLRIFTLADHAAATPDGKLYIAGGGVNRTAIPRIPGQLGQIWLAIWIRIPWHMTSQPMQLRLRGLDADHNPIAQDPLMQADIEMGRPPGVRPGDEIGIPLALGLAGVPIQAEGTIYFHLELGDEELGVMPLTVQRLMLPPGVQPAQS